MLLKLATEKYIRDGYNVLEIGCGNCKVLNKIIELTKPSEVVGIDMYKHDDFPENARYINMNLENYNLDGKFNAIIMDNVLEHLKNPIGILEKLKSNIKLGGVLLIAVPNRYGWNNEARVYFPYHGKHYFLYDRKNIEFMLNRIGYTCRFHNIYGQLNKPIYVQLFLKLFKIQNPSLIIAAFPE